MTSTKTPKKIKSKRIAYSNMKDDEKVLRNWRKAHSLYKKKEYSVTVLRCAICIELAVNFAIRQELVEKRKLPLLFVNKLLTSANGLRNKYLNIFLAIRANEEGYSKLKTLWGKRIEKISKERNSVAHSGEFRSKRVAKEIMKQTFAVLKEIMDLYNHSAKLKKIEP